MNKLINGLYMTLVLFVINCDCLSLQDEIKSYADHGDVIDGFFKPYRKLGEGTYGLVWKGALDQVNEREMVTQYQNNRKSNFQIKNTTQLIMPITNIDTKWKPIAMKIMINSDLFNSECQIYTKLLADKNQTLEQYGITAVWYKGDLLGKYHAIGMTFCDVSIWNKFQENGKVLDSIDLMVVFYQVLKILKYIHGREVIHLDLRPDNLMAKGAQLFIIDFNSANLLGDVDDNRYFVSINKWRAMQSFYLDELKKLHDVILDLAGVKLPYFVSKFDIIPEFHKQIDSEAVRNILIYYNNEITMQATNMMNGKEDEKTFDFNGMGNKILDVIEELSGSRDPFFTWLSDDEKIEAKKNLISIESVPGPSPRGGFKAMLRKMKNKIGKVTSKKQLNVRTN